jgi:hypothetical protein
MKTWKAIAALILAALPLAAQAHPGHPGLDHGVAHVIASPGHIVIGLSLVLLMGALTAALVRWLGDDAEIVRD